MLEGEHALDVVAVDFFAGDGVDDRGLDAEEGEGGGAGLCRSDTGERCDDVGTGFGLPVGLRWVSLWFANLVKQGNLRRQRVRSPYQ